MVFGLEIQYTDSEIYYLVGNSEKKKCIYR